MVVSKKMCAMKITKYSSTDLRHFFKHFSFGWSKQLDKRVSKASNLHQTIYYKHYKYIAFLKLYFKQLPVEDVLETKLELLVLFMIGGINWKLFGRLRRRCSSDRNGRLGVNCQCSNSSVKYQSYKALKRDLLQAIFINS